MSTNAPAGGVDAVLADAVAELVNRTLDLDPASAARLAALEGRRIRLESSLPVPFAGQLTLTVQAGRLRLVARDETPPHVVIHGSPADLLAWVVGADGAAQARLGIDGDDTAAQELVTVLRRFRPDPDGPLSALFGPEVARTALGAAELALAGLRSAAEGAGRSLRDNAAQTFIDRKSLGRLLDDLDDLRLRVDRLGARVAAREQRGAAP